MFVWRGNIHSYFRKITIRLFFCLLPTSPILLLVVMNNLQPSAILCAYILKRIMSCPKQSKEVKNEAGTLHLLPVAFYKSWWRKAECFQGSIHYSATLQQVLQERGGGICMLSVGTHCLWLWVLWQLLLQYEACGTGQQGKVRGRGVRREGGERFRKSKLAHFHTRIYRMRKTLSSRFLNVLQVYDKVCFRIHIMRCFFLVVVGKKILWIA